MDAIHATTTTQERGRVTRLETGRINGTVAFYLFAFCSFCFCPSAFCLLPFAFCLPYFPRPPNPAASRRTLNADPRPTM